MGDAGAYSEWSESTPEMQTNALRMLLDERVVGGFRCWPMSIQYHEPGETLDFFVFCDPPTITMNRLLADYGSPSGRKEGRDGLYTLTFGTVRFVADNTDALKVVLHPQINIPAD